MIIKVMNLWDYDKKKIIEKLWKKCILLEGKKNQTMSSVAYKQQNKTKKLLVSKYGEYENCLVMLTFYLIMLHKMLMGKSSIELTFNNTDFKCI